MQSKTKRISALVFGVILIAIGTFLILNSKSKQDSIPPQPTIETTSPVHIVIGMSVEGRAINAYQYGTGAKSVLFVGGIHGGYEWNSVLLAYSFMDYLDANPNVIPENLQVTIVPVANPDGLYKVIGKEGRFTASDVKESTTSSLGRFNANGVDLNRNFACKWQPKSSWRGNTVSAGTQAFSEPEALAIRDLVLESKPAAAIFWHSQANAVYASECENGILPATRTLMTTYAAAAGYPAIDTFDAYPVTGDVEGWLASIGIPAITVELKTHETIEWEKNLKGFEATLKYLSL